MHVVRERAIPVEAAVERRLETKEETNEGGGRGVDNSFNPLISGSISESFVDHAGKVAAIEHGDPKGRRRGSVSWTQNNRELSSACAEKVVKFFST
jgi:hypothetical protein